MSCVSQCFRTCMRISFSYIFETDWPEFFRYRSSLLGFEKSNNYSIFPLSKVISQACARVENIEEKHMGFSGELIE